MLRYASCLVLNLRGSKPAYIVQWCAFWSAVWPHRMQFSDICATRNSFRLPVLPVCGSDVEMQRQYRVLLFEYYCVLFFRPCGRILGLFLMHLRNFLLLAYQLFFFGPDIISVIRKASFNPQTRVKFSNTSDVCG